MEPRLFFKNGEKGWKRDGIRVQGFFVKTVSSRLLSCISLGMTVACGSVMKTSFHAILRISSLLFHMLYYVLILGNPRKKQNITIRHCFCTLEQIAQFCMIFSLFTGSTLFILLYSVFYFYLSFPHIRASENCSLLIRVTLRGLTRQRCKQNASRPSPLENQLHSANGKKNGKTLNTFIKRA